MTQDKGKTEKLEKKDSVKEPVKEQVKEQVKENEQLALDDLLLVQSFHWTKLTND